MSRTYTGPRTTGGFSLDDASRAYRRISAADHHTVCPSCGAEMDPVGDAVSSGVWIMRCRRCGCGLVLPRGEHRGTTE